MLSAFGSSELGFRFGLVPGAWVFHWAYFFFGPGEWACAPFFQTPLVAPQPLCTVHLGKGYNVSGVISMCKLGAGSVRALSPSYVL